MVEIVGVKMEMSKVFPINGRCNMEIMDTNTNTQITFEVNKQTLVIDASTWRDFNKMLNIIDTEFVSRYYSPKMEEKFEICDGFIVVIAGLKDQTHLILWSDNESIDINSYKWYKLKENLDQIELEFSKICGEE